MFVSGIRVSDADLVPLFTACIQQGWVIKGGGIRHFKMIPPDKTKRIVFCASTGSDGARGVKNLRAELRRNGLKI